MKYAVFLGCWIQTQQYSYEMSTRAVLGKLGVELVDPTGFSCCGYPIRSYNDSSWFYLSARNLAIAEREGLDILPLCNGCYASLNEVKHYLGEFSELKEEINDSLALEGLRFSGDAKIFHLLEVLHNEVGVDTIQNVIKEPLSGFKIGTHCGCHAIRPSDFKFTDEPEDPVLLENLTKALGAETPYYPEKMDCCGATLVLTDYEAAFKLTGVKLQSLQKRGYDALVTNCPFCLKMYDSRQEAVGKIIHQEDLSLPVFYITQLIGLTLGLDEETLGLNLHMSPVDEFVEKLRDA